MQAQMWKIGLKKSRLNLNSQVKWVIVNLSFILLGLFENLVGILNKRQLLTLYFSWLHTLHKQLEHSRRFRVHAGEHRDLRCRIHLRLLIIDLHFDLPFYLIFQKDKENPQEHSAKK